MGLPHGPFAHFHGMIPWLILCYQLNVIALDSDGDSDNPGQSASRLWVPHSPMLEFDRRPDACPRTSSGYVLSRILSFDLLFFVLRCFLFQ